MCPDDGYLFHWLQVQKPMAEKLMPVHERKKEYDSFCEKEHIARTQSEDPDVAEEQVRRNP